MSMCQWCTCRANMSIWRLNWWFNLKSRISLFFSVRDHTFLQVYVELIKVVKEHFPVCKLKRRRFYKGSVPVTKHAGYVSGSWSTQIIPSIKAPLTAIKCRRGSRWPPQVRDYYCTFKRALKRTGLRRNVSKQSASREAVRVVIFHCFCSLAFEKVKFS